VSTGFAYVTRDDILKGVKDGAISPDEAIGLLDSIRPTYAKRDPEKDREALASARGNFSMSNFVPVISEFAARGIPVDEILPKENVFTYRAWRALGRQVRKGEKGVSIGVWRPISKETVDEATGEKKRTGRTLCVGATVFHISQTDPIE